ncbi:MAG: molybdopterin-guanine dinucleotide biosynthesis protein B [Halodesulfurarchaeum sp.]|nr:molybdopterin-guanine dinucleotide biosynthesis protein B [Halodesulfurarchaeum sp.]
MKVVSVAGNRNAGKTSLIETLLQAVPEGSAVATIKSIHHEVEFDTPGTDTHRHRSAGADVVLGITPSQTAEFRTEGKNDGVTIQDTLEDLATRTVDWTFVEGFKSAALPTILVGDIDEAAVQGPVLFRIRDGTAVDGPEIWARLESVPDWDSDSA